MNYYLITLQRTPERLKDFCLNNKNFLFDIFPACDGQTLSEGTIQDPSLFSEQIINRYTRGALGVALSHRELWQKCIALNEPITVIEDDAYLNKNFTKAAENIEQNKDHWDFIFWGSNPDQNVTLDLVPGVMRSEFRTDVAMLQHNINNFRDIEVVPLFYRCLFAIGLVCYSITPTGAKHLLNTVFPLRDYDKPYLNYGVDHSVLEEIPNMRTYYSMPPLAMTKNDVGSSTVQNS